MMSKGRTGHGIRPEARLARVDWTTRESAAQLVSKLDRIAVTDLPPQPAMTTVLWSTVNVVADTIC